MSKHVGNRPWHQRIPLLGWLRGAARKAFFSCLEKAARTDDGKSIMAKTLPSPLSGRRVQSELGARLLPSPYPDLGIPPGRFGYRHGNGSVIITARFRSGSTLLWNLFRHLEGFTAYYEPLNERRWFDPKTRGDKLDATHRNVSDYWKEYDGLDVLGRYYREDWIRSNLLMDESAWDPDMKQYVDVLINMSQGRAALQFNRIDFRLSWFRKHYPGAKIIHLYRHPREQWCSSLLDIHGFSKCGQVDAFGRHDHFYLLMWAMDLKHHFPFLDPQCADHPYEIFYYIWKLSYLFGRAYADYSLSFEDLVRDPDDQLQRLFQVLDIQSFSLEQLRNLISAPQADKWKEYAGAEWFQQREAKCEAVLDEWFGVPIRRGEWSDQLGEGRYDGAPSPQSLAFQQVRHDAQDVGTRGLNHRLVTDCEAYDVAGR